jgi:hypothetical protein
MRDPHQVLNSLCTDRDLELFKKWDTSRPRYPVLVRSRREHVKSISAKRSLVPLASGVTAIGLGMTTLIAPAYADNEPLLEPKIGVEKPMVKMQVAKKVKEKQDVNFKEPPIEQKLEPKEIPSFEPKEPKQPVKQVQDDEPVAEPTQQIGPAPIADVQPEPKVTKPVPAPVPQTASATKYALSGKTIKSQTLKSERISSVDAEPVMAPSSSVEPVVAAQAVSQTTKDTTPIQPTENGGELPKTAGNGVQYMMAGAFFLLGALELQRYKRMRTDG